MAACHRSYWNWRFCLGVVVSIGTERENEHTAALLYDSTRLTATSYIVSNTVGNEKNFMSEILFRFLI